MSSEQWQTLGVVLLLAGAVVLVISQLLLSRWRKKIISGQ